MCEDVDAVGITAEREKPEEEPKHKSDSEPPALFGGGDSQKTKITLSGLLNAIGK